MKFLKHHEFIITFYYCYCRQIKNAKLIQCDVFPYMYLPKTGSTDINKYLRLINIFICYLTLFLI